MSDEDQHDEPLEEVGPEDCGPAPEQCGLGAGVLESETEDVEVSLREEMFEAFKPELEVLVPSTVDGMPVPKDETQNLALAHPFSIDTVVCVEDTRRYVEIFADEVGEFPELQAACKLGRVALVRPGASPIWSAIARFVGKTLVQCRVRHDGSGVERKRISCAPEAVEVKFGCDLARFAGGIYVAVRPTRPRCKHYRRQILANDDVPTPADFGHFMLFRNCTMRRSVGGAFMSVRDEAVYACDYRDPPDEPSQKKYLDDKDDKRLLSSNPPEQVPLFNLKG